MLYPPMLGTAEADTARCVDIATTAALRRMILPGVIAVSAPVVVGMGLGAASLGGMLGGALLGCVLMALMMAMPGTMPRSMLKKAITAAKDHQRMLPVWWATRWEIRSKTPLAQP